MDFRPASFQSFSNAAERVARLPFEFDPNSDMLPFGKRSYYRIALPVALCGSTGIWSPSCIASAQVAVDELNRKDGIGGRQVQLIMVDAAQEARIPVEEVINDLIESEAIDAIVGMHISAIRQRLSKVVRQRVPFVYTPMYEGGETTPGIFTISETPDFQLGPAIDFLKGHYHARNWALIGNDYVWPRVSHNYAKQKLKNLGGNLVFERYIPFGFKDMRPLMQELEQSRPDVVLMSLVGDDAVQFNRLFGKMDLHRKMVRMSSALEENGLLAIGADGLKRLYSSSSYYGALQTEVNAAFREKYYNFHGEYAPMLNTLGQSVYEGIHYLASMTARYSQDWRTLSNTNARSLSYPSARWLNFKKKEKKLMPIYLSRSEGVEFEIIKTLANF